MRHAVLLVTTLTSFLLYLDRVCVAEIVKVESFQNELVLDRDRIGLVLAAFFYAYALAQVPAGWFSDRFGARGMMTFYIGLWSVFTALTGLAGGLVTLLIARIGCGIAQAGAYPASGALLSRWIPFGRRALASSVVAFGGRAGGAVAPLLTVLLVVNLGNWRWPLLLFGGAGLLVAGLFWMIFREQPADHPRCNAVERALVEESRPPGATLPRGRATRVPLRQLLASRSLWLMCVSQWCSNVGWVFLVTWLPTYLRQVKQVEPVSGGRMATTALLVGMAGMLFGGWITDAATRRLGLRWGRVLPLALSRFLAAAAYVSCLWLDSPWAVTAAFAAVAFMTDLGLPPCWAYFQDVGGKNVGSVLGWANMWGNLGAGATSQLLPWVLKTWDHNQDWHEAFLLCAASFVIAGVASLGIDARAPVVPTDEQRN